MDADWANERSDCSSTSGYVYKLTRGAISWSSKKQSSIALSSAEAEFIAGAHAAKEAVWLRRLLTELGLLDHDHNATVLCMDSQSAMAIAKTRNSMTEQNISMSGTISYAARLKTTKLNSNIPRLGTKSQMLLRKRSTTRNT
jgi:hypothetical protein